MTKDIDVRSAEPVLFHVEGVVAGVPAADLSGNALARLAWIAAGPKRPEYPHDMDQKAIAAYRDELVATGKYSLKEKP